MARLSVVSAAFLSLALVACGEKAPSSPPEKVASVAGDPKPEPPKEDPKKEEPKAEEPKAEAPKPEPAKEEPKPEATADAGEAAPDSGFPATVEDKPTTLVTATPGTIVRDPAPDSPEWLIQQVLVAAMEPDEAKGWAIFESLLHEDQKIEKALISRRQLNYPASRRKVKLFLFEDPTKPIYRIDRVVEETPTLVRIYVHNNSEGGMPTPCEVRYDQNLKKWRIGICSL